MRPLRVIVADDDRDSVLSLSMLLRAEGHDVHGLHTGGHVVDLVRELNPDAVLLDIALPDVSGWQVAQAIRERLGRRALLIGISGQYRHSADRVVSEILGFDHYLLKPYDPNELLALLAPLGVPSAP